MAPSPIFVRVEVFEQRQDPSESQSVLGGFSTKRLNGMQWFI